MTQISTHSTFNIHGVNVKFTSDEYELLRVIQYNFAHFLSDTSTTDEIDIDINIDGYWAYGQAGTFSPKKEILARRLGTELYENNGKLYWITPRIRTETFFKDNQLFIRGDYTERQDHTLRRILFRNRSIPYQNYQVLMRHTVHAPLFWWLARSNGIGVLHASSVVKNDLTLIFTGLNGSGKSSIATHLWMHEGFRLLSDNYLLFNSNKLYGFPEVIRTNTNLTGETGIQYTLPATVFNKYQAVLSASHVSMTAPIGHIFLTSIGRKTTITPIPYAKMLNWMERIYSFLNEFMENTYMIFFDPHHLPTGWLYHWQEQLRQNLKTLVQSSQCYELEVGYGEPPEETVNQLLKNLQ